MPRLSGIQGMHQAASSFQAQNFCRFGCAKTLVNGDSVHCHILLILGR